MKKIKVREMVLTSLFVGIIAVCSFISFPFPGTGVPITLQIFAVFLATLILGGKWGSVSVLVYLMIGALGAPVFAGFKGGIGSLLGVTGGYLIGFIFIPLTYLLINLITKNEKIYIKIISLVIGLIICYAFGTIWFVILYSRNTGAISFIGALSNCVIPFIIPDIAKMVLAFLVFKLIEPIKIKYFDKK